MSMNEIDILQELDSSPPPQEKPRGGLTPGSIVLLTGIVLVIVVVALGLARSRMSQPTQGQTAPDFTVTTFDGDTVNLSDYRGQVVVLNFWASWCVPCRVEAPALERVWQDYRDRGVVVLGVTYADTERDSRAFIEEFGLTYPNAPDTGTRISRELYFITGAPESFFIDRDGQVVDFVIGAVDEDDLRARLDAMLAA
jgi:cytochrome c biogenesis protein CcmG, thiol:disulfide interchange protein DsbE